MTPVMYPISIFPQNLVKLIGLNPMAVIITSYRSLIIDGQWVAWQTLVKLAGSSFAVFLMGFFWFIKTKKLFADVL
jgi:lipopolysaccharide transport system permease protein